MNPENDNRRTRRRPLLKGFGTAAFVTGVAGCVNIERTYTAPFIGLSEDVRGQFEMSLLDADTIRVEQQLQAADNKIQATIINRYSYYRGNFDLGIVSTPKVAIVGQQLNPLVNKDVEELLQEEQARSLLDRAGEDATETDSEWDVEPEQVHTAQGTLLGDSISIESYIGLTTATAEGIQIASLINLVRLVREDDAVIVGSPWKREYQSVSDPEDRPLVGDAGLFSETEIDETLDELREVLPELQEVRPELISRQLEATDNFTSEEQWFGCFAEGAGEEIGHVVVESSLDDLPITVRLNHPKMAVNGVNNIISLEVEIEDTGLLSSSKLYEPHATLVFDGVKITHVLPGDFPLSVRSQNSSGKSFAEGVGIGEPWKAGKLASFGVAIQPKANARDISVDMLVNARKKDGGDITRGHAEASIRAGNRSNGKITREHFASSAEQRALLAERFGEILRAQSTFREEAQQELRDAILAIGIGSINMLADEAFGSVIGIASKPAEYLWEAYSLHYKSPFEYVLDSEALTNDDNNDGIPDDPTSVGSIDPANYGLPFFSALLSNAQGLMEQFEILVEHYDYRARVQEGASKVLLHVIADVARQEATAWRNREDQLARQLLADQLYMIDGTDRGADTEQVEARFDDNEDLSEYPNIFNKDSYHDESQDLVQKLFEVKALRDSHPNYSPELVSAIHSMHRFMEGEGNRVNDMIEYYDNC